MYDTFAKPALSVFSPKYMPQTLSENHLEECAKNVMIVHILYFSMNLYEYVFDLQAAKDAERELRNGSIYHEGCQRLEGWRKCISQ